VASIRLVTLGSLRCESSAGEITALAAQRQRLAVLIYLGLERDTTRERVMAVFWPDREPERARHALSQTLYDLRRALGDGWLKVQSDHLIVTGALEIDAARFAGLVEAGDPGAALPLYKGEFLAGEYLANTSEFENWVSARRRKLSALHRQARRDLLNALGQAGDHANIVLEARRWLDVDGTEDEAHQRLIEALARVGRRSEALQQYATYERMLKAEGLKPLDEIVALVGRLRAGDFLPSAVQETEPVLSVPGTPPSAEGVDTPVADASPEKGIDAQGRRLKARMLFAGAAIVLAGVFLPARDGGVTERLRFLGNGVRAPGVSVPDTSMYVILPVDADTAIDAALQVDERLFDALHRWDGIMVVPLSQVSDAVARMGMPRSPAEGVRLARELGAGRALWTTVSRLPEALRIEVTLYDASGDLRSVESFTGRLPQLSSADSFFHRAADAVLLTASASAATVPATTSLPASNSYHAGQAALRTWDLERADTLFRRATEADSAYAAAYLWLAQVRSWMQDRPRDWVGYAEKAEAGRDHLSGHDRRLAKALVHMSRREYVEACLEYDSLAESSALSFAAWFGKGDCRRLDDTVLRDANTGQWRFRGSYHTAIRAYRRAFELDPSSLAIFKRNGFARLRQLLLTVTYLRAGRALPTDTTRFLARVTFVDSLQHVPYPVAAVRAAALSASSPRSTIAAIQHLHAVFREVAENWARKSPNNVDALGMVALGLELQGDPAALDTLRRARALAADPDLELQLAALEVFLRVKFGMPDRVNELRAARLLADSILKRSAGASTHTVNLLASVAALTGRVHETATLARTSARQGSRRPQQLWAASQAMLAYSVLGGPADSIAVLEAQIASGVKAHFAPETHAGTYYDLVGRAASLALPAYRFPPLIWEHSDDYMLAIEAAYLQGRHAAARALLDTAQLGRRYSRSIDAKFDGLFPEAWVLRAMGDPRAAYAWVQPSLDAVAYAPSQYMGDFAYTASLVRAAALRAELAWHLGKRADARRWARAVLALWSPGGSRGKTHGADPAIQSVVEAMRRIERS
jgi:DNA-binding SARP family transcriptional activator